MFADGSVRYVLGESLIVVAPHDPLYSTALMVATEYYDGEECAWKSIEEK